MIFVLILTLSANVAVGEPAIKDEDFAITRYVSGIENGAVSMAFMGEDILVLQKDDGKVRLIRDGRLQVDPVLDVAVTNAGEQGMLGIATVNSTVYLYFTESNRDGGEPLGKRVYRYDWNGEKLVNPVLLRDLRETQTYHNGGAMVTGLDGSVYLILGDAGHFGKLQNKPVGDPDDTSVILRVAPEGPYYAIGIRNSFGLAVDPQTGQLWDTENGDDDSDEVNLVPQGFNSGWDRMMGPASESELSSLPGYAGYTYSDPEFTWERITVPTAISFVNSSQMAKYRDSLFVASCSQGNLYRFALNESRDGFVFEDPALADRVLDVDDSMDEIVFGTGFGCVTDMEVGPDGFLYFTSFSGGSIYKMAPRIEVGVDTDANPASIYVIYVAIAAAGGVAAFLALRKRNSDIHQHTK
ncbi:MAG: PQQ-dependent sugar dehydrogenase [Nitrososphaera sp.]|nr:PQQ-dependent sugar dehydrogenase [Nitrososphaera sp.]